MSFRDDFEKIIEPIQLNQNMPKEDFNAKSFPLIQFIRDHVPNQLYKFRGCTEHSLDAFEKDELWLSKASLFNDPHDSLFFFDKESIDWRQAPCGCWGFYQHPAFCSCGGRYAPACPPSPTHDWRKRPTPPSTSRRCPGHSNRWYPHDDFSSRLCRPGCGCPGCPDCTLSGTSAPTYHQNGEAGSSA